MIVRGQKVDTQEKIEVVSLVDTVTARLEAAVMSGELAPGDRIREQVLATQWGISRGPLREAIRRLEGRRLLERTANIGVRVVSLTPTRLEELLTVREALEGMACRLAAERITDADIEALTALLRSHSESEAVVAGEGYYQLSGDVDFHFRIARASGNDYLMSLITGDLYDLMRVYRYRSSAVPGRTATALAEHRGIVEALALRDPDLSEQRMREHIRNARLTARAALERSPPPVT